MRSAALRRSSEVFDHLERWWERPTTQRGLATVLVAVFVGGLVAVEARRRGWLSEGVSEIVSTSHFQALHLAFTLLLLFEVIALVFGLARSVARAAGMQFEIMSLILIRQSFKELRGLPEPIDADAVSGVVPYILSDSVGALLIFMVLAVYYRMQRHRPITEIEEERVSFIQVKKLVALLLLAALVALGADLAWRNLSVGADFAFFEAFYTLLVFADVLIVLVSLRYSTAYPVVFRYFGFAVATVLVRLALTAPRFWDAALGLAGVLFALALSWAYNFALATTDQRRSGHGDGGRD